MNKNKFIVKYKLNLAKKEIVVLLKPVKIVCALFVRALLTALFVLRF